MKERTLVLLKPDAVSRQLCGTIISRFENVGLKIVGMKMLWVDDQFSSKHYHDVKERRGEQVYLNLMKMITSGPIIAMVLEGIHAPELVRKMVGATESKSAAPGTIRGDFSHHSYAFADAEKKAIQNVVHASANKEEADFEINLWFSESELFDYETVHQTHTQ